MVEIVAKREISLVKLLAENGVPYSEIRRALRKRDVKVNGVRMNEDLPLAAVRAQIASALDILIHLGRMKDKSRKVCWIVEVDGYEEGVIRLHTLYQLEDGVLQKKGELKHRQKLWTAGEEL